MSNATELDAVAQNIMKFWAPVFVKEWRASLLLGALVNKDYQGQIKKGGDEVTVTQVNAPKGQLLDAQTQNAFDSDPFSVSNVKIKADKRAVAAFEFADIIELQNQIDIKGSEGRDALEYALRSQVNDYLYSLVSPSTSSPDHVLTGITDMTKTQVGSIRTLAAQARWSKLKKWYALLDPQYYQDILDESDFSSSEQGAIDAPTISGQLALPRYGFNILEDDSRSADEGLFFHPDFLHLVTQNTVQVKISDLHGQKKFGVLMSVDIIFGAKLGIDGDKRHISISGS